MAESLAHTATVPINMVGISLSKQVKECFGTWQREHWNGFNLQSRRELPEARIEMLNISMPR